MLKKKRVRRSYGTDDVYADEPSDSTPTLLSLDAIPSEEREASAWLMDPSDFTKGDRVQRWCVGFLEVSHSESTEGVH